MRTVYVQLEQNLKSTNSVAKQKNQTHNPLF